MKVEEHESVRLRCSTILSVFEPTVTLNGNPISPHLQCHASGPAHAQTKPRERKAATEAAVTHLAFARSQKAGNDITGYNMMTMPAATLVCRRQLFYL